MKKVIDPEQVRYDAVYEEILFNKITTAFSWRERPKDMWELSFEYSKIIMPDDEIALKQFLGKNWSDITLDIYMNYVDALYAFTPLAYAYYLPGLLITTAKDIATDEKGDRRELINTVIFPLMNFEEILSDSYRFDRWAKLTVDEYLAIKDWLMWVTKDDIYQEEDVVYSLINLGKLIERAKKQEK
ncbi:hypothetical protein [Gilliamella sp. Pas-s25]|uniref:hypothetical protein n=1 Tax=Gilliamella sp. Pas-s25 TaxID=2687310 RepID=UPI00135D41C2|nr:hypothetical protein [Gilliamella sp. Pas-s25]MWP62968.1 hypothetical protein [Gilliamella sp. Pas-s25]